MFVQFCSIPWPGNSQTSPGYSFRTTHDAALSVGVCAVCGATSGTPDSGEHTMHCSATDLAVGTPSHHPFPWDFPWNKRNPPSQLLGILLRKPS